MAMLKLSYLHPLLTHNFVFSSKIPAKLFPERRWRFISLSLERCEATIRSRHIYMWAVLSCNRRWGYDERRVSGLFAFIRVMRRCAFLLFVDVETIAIACYFSRCVYFSLDEASAYYCCIVLETEDRMDQSSHWTAEIPTVYFS